MKILRFLLPIAALLAAGCSTKIQVPPGSLTSWHHIGSYGPFVSDDVTIQDVTKNADGTFTVGHYDGQLKIMGFGPKDIIDGLKIDGTGQPVAAAPK